MLKLMQISTVDIAGADAVAVVQLVERDKLRRESGPAHTLRVKLLPAERQAMQAIRDRAIVRMQARINKADADITADPNATINLDAPLAGEEA